MARENISAFSENGFGPTIEALKEEIQGLYLLDDIPWVLGYSGGKDSTAIAQLIWLAISDLAPGQRKKTVHIISTDTLVESPIVSSWVRLSLERMKAAAEEQEMPIIPHHLEPAIKDTFWVNLIGRGYPAPRHLFRWCTYRLKIQPSNTFIQNVVRESGEAILVLGTRKAESAKRHATMKRHEAKRLREKLTPNANLPNSLIYTPIEDWTNDDVWVFLMQIKNLWGHPHKDLMTMYRGATADGECPLVVDTSTPSCGTSRFGCWVCTLVDRDRSMEAMIQNDDEKDWMLPLLELRNELDPRGSDGKPDDKDRRDWRRMSGKVQLFERVENGETKAEPIKGPYVKEWREHWLRRILDAQEAIRKTGPKEVQSIELIRTEELEEIRRIWLTEKFEFDDALPRIYQEITGNKYFAQKDDGVVLGRLEWALLSDACGNDSLHMELIARLLGKEREFNAMGVRRGLYEALEECFEIAGFESEEEAIEEARIKRALKDGISPHQGDETKAPVEGDQ